MPLNYERIMAHRPPDIPVHYGPRECMLYALGIGLGMDPMDRQQLRFVYERADIIAYLRTLSDNPVPLPTASK